MVPKVAKLQNALEQVKTIMPHEKIFFRPYMSPKRLKGTGKIAEPRRKIVTIHVNEIVFMENSFAIFGSARLSEDPIKGTSIVAIQITNRIEKRSAEVSLFFIKTNHIWYSKNPFIKLIIFVIISILN